MNSPTKPGIGVLSRHSNSDCVKDSLPTSESLDIVVYLGVRCVATNCFLRLRERRHHEVPNEDLSEFTFLLHSPSGESPCLSNLRNHPPGWESVAKHDDSDVMRGA
jgi:hypothetical protein